MRSSTNAKGKSCHYITLYFCIDLSCGEMNEETFPVRACKEIVIAVFYGMSSWGYNETAFCPYLVLLDIEEIG